MEGNQTGTTGREPAADRAIGNPQSAICNPIKRVHFIEFNARVNTLGTGAILPKYGTALLGAILREQGYEVRIFLEGVSDMDFEAMTECDALCLPVYAPAYNKVRGFAARVRREKPGIPVIVGGPHVCLFPETALDFCDYAIRCEADEVLPELLARLSRGEDARSVPGVSSRRNGETFHTPDPYPPAVPATAPDLTLIQGLERLTAGAQRRLVLNTLQTSRGCRCHCRFCPTSRLFGDTYRNRDIDAVVADIRSRLRWGRLFFVVDNSFLSNRGRTVELLRRLIREDLGVHFMVFERHEIGKDPELLDLMRRAGVRCIIVGIESLSDESLQLYNKRQRSGDVAASVDVILSHGIHVLGTFMLGGDEDTPARADEIVRFTRETGISPNFFIMHDVFSDAAQDLLIPMHRRFQTYYERADPGNTGFMDYLTGNFVTYFPKRMRPSTLQECAGQIFRELFSHRENLRRIASPNLFNALFGVAHAYSVKRMSENVQAIVDGGYLGYLRGIEDGLYDANEELMEDRLGALPGLPQPAPLPEHLDFDRYKTLTVLGLMPGLARAGLLRLRAGLGRGQAASAAG